MITSEGYTRAIELLSQATTPIGFVASTNVHDNYKRVWTRDGVITGLASLLVNVETLTEGFRQTLITIFDHQHKLGFMPSNVSEDGKASYGGTVGRADNPSWAVIGLCQYTLRKNDFSLVREYEAKVEKCFHLLDVWEYNGKHLVYVPQSGDWADEYHYHGYVLFDQLLRVWALGLAAKVFDRQDWSAKASQIQEVIGRNFWNNAHDTNLYAPNLIHQKKSAPRNFWFMGFNPSRIYDNFDLQANTLALLLLEEFRRENEIAVSYLDELAREYRSMIPSFYPAAKQGDWQMDELKNNFAYSFRNHEHEFHNGGLWPVWNGFAVAALIKNNRRQQALTLTRCIHESNSLHHWEFNECFHGTEQRPIGVRHCTWSAAGAIIAENAVHGNQLMY